PSIYHLEQWTTGPNLSWLSAVWLLSHQTVYTGISINDTNGVYSGHHTLTLPIMA
ncbi:hypothetical protein GBAR_LOCUS12575, partial [Geodia barretti]